MRRIAYWMFPLSILLSVAGLMVVMLVCPGRKASRGSSYNDLLSGAHRLSVNEIAAGLKASSPIARYVACHQAGMAMDPSFEDDLIRLTLTDSVRRICDAAALGLARMHSDKLGRRLLQGENFPVATRSRIAQTLRSTNSEVGISALRKLLKDPSDTVVEDALFATYYSPLGKLADLRSVRGHQSKIVRELAKRLEDHGKPETGSTAGGLTPDKVLDWHRTMTP